MVISTKKVTVINPAKSKLREIEVTRKKYIREIDELKEQISSISSELDDVTKSLTTTRRKNVSSNKLIKEKETKIASLISEQKNIELAISNYGNISPQTIKDSFDESKKLEEEIIKLNKRIIKAKKTLSDNEEKSFIVDKAIAQKQNELSELDKKIDVKDTTLKSHNSKISDLKKQAEAYENELVNKDKLFEKNEQTKLLIANNKKTLKTLNEESAALVNANSKLKNENDEAEQIKNKFVEDTKKLESLIVDLMNKIVHKKKEFENIDKQIKSKLNLLETRKSEISSLIMNNKQHLKSEKVANFLREIENGL